jgi:hypothetical protein
MSALTWEKKELIITPQPSLSWMRTHAMVPTIYHVHQDLFRVYFSGRDDQNRSHVGYCDVEVHDGEISVLRYSKDPCLSLGELGTFDDNGVTPSCVVDGENNQQHLYYIGWNSGSTTRMSLIAGLAISHDKGLSFARNSRAPLLDRTDREPFAIITAPFVLKDEDHWKLWYVSCEGWEHRDLPTYNIKYAESNDGVHWQREGHVCIDFKDENEKALARPCVIKENNLYRMWFSYKDPAIGYRIGYAESDNGKNWVRMDDQSGMDVSAEGWDSEMIEYANVFEHKCMRYMLYNGNEYGKGGIGYAVSRK